MQEVISWQAKWIWGRSEGRGAFEGGASDDRVVRHDILYFRHSFDLLEPPSSLIVAVSADSRYRMYINGVLTVAGPCKGDAYTHYYETLDLAPLLRAGKNTIAVKAVHYGDYQPYRVGAAGPASVFRSQRGGFILEGSFTGEAEGLALTLSTGTAGWRCYADKGVSYCEGAMGRQYVGYPETVEGRWLPHGWQDAEYDDSGWQEPIVVSPAIRPYTGEQTPWNMKPRPIPLMRMEACRFSGVSRAVGLSPEEIEGLLHGQQLTVKPHRSLSVDLDAGELVTGYLQLACSGGGDGEIRLITAECYEHPPGPRGQRRKGIRDLAELEHLFGDSDCYFPAGNAGGIREEVYEPFELRAFRFVRLEIRTEEEPICLNRLFYRDSAYPLEVHAAFFCSDPRLDAIWKISLRTLQRCMHDTYVDCPFYEQLQYVMDTMMQAVFTYNVSGDDRLARRAMYDFHSSMLPEGLIQSRFPSIFPQIIPGFALMWIMMIKDHYMYFGDRELVGFYRPSMEQVLNWFDSRLTEEGLLGPMPPHYWAFVDWVEEWKQDWGVPSAASGGPIAVYSLMYAAALRAAAELNEETGRQEVAVEYRCRADKVIAAVRRCCWFAERGLYRDGPDTGEISQHTQLWAVLCGAERGEAAAALMRKALDERNLAKVSYAMTYFLMRALAQAGMYHRSFSLWSKWQEQVKLGLTTWMEDPVSQRSDCHAWGAVPLFEFPARLLGVEPHKHGFDEIRIKPHPGPLAFAQGTVPTRHGPVRVAWRLEAGAVFAIQAEVPVGIPVVLILPSGEEFTFPKGGRIEAQCRSKPV